MQTYHCQSCKQTATVEDNQKAPTCCGKPMEQIPKEICLQPAHAEHARPMESNDACDEFRGG